MKMKNEQKLSTIITNMPAREHYKEILVQFLYDLIWLYDCII